MVFYSFSFEFIIFVLVIQEGTEIDCEFEFCIFLIIIFDREKVPEVLVRGGTRLTLSAFDVDAEASISRRAVAVLVPTLPAAFENVSPSFASLLYSF